MERKEYLSLEEINILLKCYYLKRYTKIAADENLTVGKVKAIRDNALRTIRLAYSKSYLQGMRFTGEKVLQHMAKRSDMKTAELAVIFDSYIAEGLASDNRKYWERIKKQGETPTAIELLDFIYDKFEVDIHGID